MDPKDKQAADRASRLMLFFITVAIGVVGLGAAAGVATRIFCWLSGVCK